MFPLKPVGAEPPVPPPPTVTVYGEPPEIDCSERFLKPPAPPPPPWSFPPPAPPPAIITVLILVVSESVVKVPEAVKTETFGFFFFTVVLTGPIIPPFAIAYSTSYASSIDSYDTNSSKSPEAFAPPFRTSDSIMYIGVSNTTNVASAGTDTVFAK